MNRIDTLLAAMTLEEKIGQLTMATAGYAITGPVLGGDVTDGIKAGTIGSLLNVWGAEASRTIQALAVENSRLKVPLFFGFDVVHGHRTVFPIPLAEAAAFDPVLWEETARASAEEAAADGLHMTFAPMIDIARDPRWGRIAEGPGEDPWVGARMAEAKVRGFQGADLADITRVCATAKHFCGYGAAIAGRDYASAEISLQTLHEVYLPPFVAAVKAGVAAVMPAFHDIGGLPLTAHIPLLRDWLRGEMGFEGVLVSDYNAIAELIKHGVAGTLAEAAALALNAGVDIDMMATAYSRGLPEALERGLTDMAHIDASVRRVLVLKERLGLFDDPYARCAPRVEGDRARRLLARKAASRSVVLLSNPAKILPLPSRLHRLAVVGPLAEARADMRGPWSAAGLPDDPVSVVEGLRDLLPADSIAFAPGIDLLGKDLSGEEAALDLCRAADAVVLCLGEAATMSGEANCRADPGLPGQQRAFAEKVFDLGVPVIVVLFSGRPLILPWLIERADAVLAAWFPGCEAGPAIAEVLLGLSDPGGRLPVSWPRHVGQVPLFFGARSGGRPENPEDHYTSKYMDMPNSPQFAFGHGLSYGDFALEALTVGPDEVSADGVIDVAVSLINKGGRPGLGCVFLFIHDPVASVARPLLELKGVLRAEVEAGGRCELRWSLPVADLAFLGADLRPRIEAGEIEIAVGRSADPEGLLRRSVRIVTPRHQG
ncbi:beta-glucosidase [Rhodospirillum rubrum]|uniref:glycoside hydrolase family 3 N-terminal domain-containing protein n=1 Tax=Rhodospirillum rubrum TaxID=1085 RepID=UPI0019056340|nr:glycoside hydrolase family 3 N-terminal domain-containing protein [Rhodospirillum rubrum]MBK1665279.1 beta-glucosidase [Rhodospirillum rubrum]MBK1677129.1 beta-glucosidase [Rhodospirillum rubrum]